MDPEVLLSESHHLTLAHDLDIAPYHIQGQKFGVLVDPIRRRFDPRLLTFDRAIRLETIEDTLLQGYRGLFTRQGPPVIVTCRPGDSIIRALAANSEGRVDLRQPQAAGLRQRELVRLAEENLRIHMGILDSLQQRLAGGGGSRADVAQTEARSARARATVTQTLNDLRDAEAAYTRIVGQYPDALEAPEFPDGVLPDNLESAVNLANTNNPTTKIFEADVKSSVAEVSIAEVPFYPAVTLEAASEYTDGADGIDTYEWNNQVMVRLRWNLFRGGIDRADRQEQLARLAESKNRRLRSFLDAQQEMRQSWFALEASRQRVEDLSDAVRFNLETRDAYRQQFEVAQRTLLDVLDAENELFVASGQLVSSQTNELLASYRILAVGGALMNTLNIQPPQQAVIEKTGWLEGIMGTN